MGNVFGKKKMCENDKQQIALDSGEEEGGWEAAGGSAVASTEF